MVEPVLRAASSRRRGRTPTNCGSRARRPALRSCERRASRGRAGRGRRPGRAPGRATARRRSRSRSPARSGGTPQRSPAARPSRSRPQRRDVRVALPGRSPPSPSGTRPRESSACSRTMAGRPSLRRIRATVSPGLSVGRRTSFASGVAEAARGTGRDSDAMCAESASMSACQTVGWASVLSLDLLFLEAQPSFGGPVVDAPSAVLGKEHWRRRGGPGVWTPPAQPQRGRTGPGRRQTRAAVGWYTAHAVESYAPRHAEGHSLSCSTS